MTRTSPRYRITTDANGCVVLTSTDEDVRAALGEYDTRSLRRVYWVPTDGGYVYDVTRQPGTSGQQVCDALQGMGHTLMSSRAGLAHTVRRELRRALREEAGTLGPRGTV